jgi:hypothetical protein
MESFKLLSVKSMYMDMMNGHTVFLRKYIWKMKEPLQIKICMVPPSEGYTHERQFRMIVRNVFSATQRSLLTIYFLCLLLLVLFGEFFHFTFNIPPPSNVTNMFGN